MSPLGETLSYLETLQQGELRIVARVPESVDFVDVE